MYNFPRNVHIKFPSFEDRGHLPPPGYLIVYQEQLEAGLRLPIAPFFVHLSDHWDISVSQLTPNAIRLIARFSFLFKLYDIPLSLYTFRIILKLSPTKGLFYISPRIAGRQLTSGNPSSIHDWKKFFSLSGTSILLCHRILGTL
ncbi:hypothetical protein ACH5RR_040982 [Cinchona calisaya]|uniref:Transposase (putative) gypsy type domain-containing protein n=1 Tax=Cinchona calisaya TaxID=153742 RepID=A0ABD2XXN2_9GENT